MTTDAPTDSGALREKLEAVLAALGEKHGEKAAFFNAMGWSEAPTRIVRANGLSAYSGLSRSATLKLVAEGKFPQPIQLTDSRRGCVGWLESELVAWQQEKVAARDAAAEELRAKRSGFTKPGRRALGQA